MPLSSNMEQHWSIPQQALPKKSHNTIRNLHFLMKFYVSLSAFISLCGPPDYVFLDGATEP